VPKHPRELTIDAQHTIFSVEQDDAFRGVFEELIEVGLLDFLAPPRHAYVR
jgi:hypothetical protein